MEDYQSYLTISSKFSYYVIMK